MKLTILSLVLGAATSLGATASAQVANQAFEVTVATERPTVGDTVVLNFRVRLDERDLLFDTIPQPTGELPPGVRILAVEKLQRTPDRIFHGQARLAFYRTGRQPVPVFGLPFMRAVKGVPRATLASDSAFVDIVPLLPVGSPPLKDIRGLERTPGPSPLPILLGLGLILGSFLIYLRQRRKRPVSIVAQLEVLPRVEVTPPSSYEMAMAELERIARENWPAQGQAARHYAAVADTLREYLERAEALPARERTSAEVLWSLPPHLTEDGLRERFRDILEEADLVKFARWRPDLSAADRFLEQSRALLKSWHETDAPVAQADAVR
jgi:hypothetical protein